MSIRCWLGRHDWINYRAWDITGYPFIACRRCQKQAA